MKTLFFCNLIPNKLGAFEALLVALAGEFQGAGDELVIAFAREPIPEVGEELRAAGARWVVIEAWTEGAGREHPWAFCRPALRLLRAENPDVAVVHFGNELPSLAAALTGRLQGIRARWIWQQDQEIRDPNPLTRHVSKLGLLRLGFHHFVGVYEGGKRSLLLRGIPESNVSVIYNAVRDHQTRRDPGWLRSELGLPEDAVLIVNVGWHIPRKRIDFVLRAVSRIANAVLVQVGEGPEQESLRRMCRKLGIEKTVHFLGLRNDVRDILAEADILAHASLAETCTYVTSESMCAGIPAVVTNAGAAREQIVDGATGYVMAADDHERFVSFLSEFATQPERRREMGRRARERWSERYRVEVSARKYHELYARIAG